jgi:hypothetical protein
MHGSGATSGRLSQRKGSRNSLLPIFNVSSEKFTTNHTITSRSPGVIRNSFLDPDYQGMKRSVFPIASRTIDSLIRTQGVGDLYQIYALCYRDGNDFNLACIPSTFTDEPTEGFDPVYMKKLLNLGYQMSLEGYPWEKAPPGFILAPE